MASVQKPGIVNRAETLEREVAFYAVCSTAAGTAAKTVSVDDYFRLETGAKVCVRFSNTNTASTPTLNVNGTGAKQIRYRNASGTSGNLAEYVAANRTYDLVYDGTCWQIVGDVDTTLALSDSISSTSSSTAASSAAVKALADLISALTARVDSLEGGTGGPLMPSSDTVASLEMVYDSSDRWYNYYTPDGGTWFWVAVHQNISEEYEANETGSGGTVHTTYNKAELLWGIDPGGTKVLYYRGGTWSGDAVPVSSVAWRIA